MKTLVLYKTLLREAEKFPSYNFRMYALRRIKDAFKENKSLTDAQKINEQINYANINLDIIRRQVVVGKLYATEKLVVENAKT